MRDAATIQARACQTLARMAARRARAEVQRSRKLQGGALVLALWFAIDCQRQAARAAALSRRHMGIE